LDGARGDSCWEWFRPRITGGEKKEGIEDERGIPETNVGNLNHLCRANGADARKGEGGYAREDIPLTYETGEEGKNIRLFKEKAPRHFVMQVTSYTFIRSQRLFKKGLCLSQKGGKKRGKRDQKGKSTLKADGQGVKYGIRHA